MSDLRDFYILSLPNGVAYKFDDYASLSDFVHARNWSEDKPSGYCAEVTHAMAEMAESEC